eukprot:2874359-Rhodomonas_salina.1
MQHVWDPCGIVSHPTLKAGLSVAECNTVFLHAPTALQGEKQGVAKDLVAVAATTIRSEAAMRAGLGLGGIYS